jgi:hypothetical protein
MIITSILLQGQKNAVVWHQLVAATVDAQNQSITSTSNGWRSGGLSKNKLSSGESGAVSYSVEETSTYKMLGLSSENSAGSYSSIAYSIYTGAGRAYIYEKGVYKGSYGRYLASDQFTVERLGTNIHYKKNGLTFHTTINIDLNQELFVDVSIYTVGGSYSKVTTTFGLPLKITVQQVSSRCEAANSGAIDITVLNGVPPYTYSWKNGAITQDLTSLEAGTYSLTVTDAAGNTIDTSVTITTGIEWENGVGGIACGTSFIKADAWLKLYGGSAYEYPRQIQKTSDGGFIVTAGSGQGSDLPGYHGGTGSDAWVLKLDKDGLVEWSKLFGGTASDILHAKEDNQGNFICAGTTNSADGDIINNHGGSDYWVVKLNASGSLMWSKTYGGSGYDAGGGGVAVTADGGYIIGGQSWSTDGDVTGALGNNDYWIVKLDVDGNIEWEKSIGGTSYEGATSINQLSNGDYFVTGITYSGADFGGQPSLGAGDLAVIRLDASGNIRWINRYGGAGYDGLFSKSVEVEDGIVIGSRSSSANGDVPKNQGNHDYWAFKIDVLGNVLWSKTYGGSGNDYFMDLRKASNNTYLLTGYTHSSDGDIHNNHGGVDIWTVKINAVGDTLWTQTYGGPNNDEGTSIVENKPGEYLLLGVYVQTESDGATNGQVCLKKVTTVNCNGEEITAMVKPTTPTQAIGISKNKLVAEEDGAITYTIRTIGESQKIGLSYTNEAVNRTTINYSYEITPTVIHIYEGNTLAQTMNTYAINDELKIAREGNQMVYYHNNKAVRTSSTDNQKVLLAKTVLLEPNQLTLETDFCNIFSVAYTVIDESPEGLGSIVLVPKNGTAPYTYFWTDGDGAKERYNLESGVYSVTVKDALLDSFVLAIPVGMQIQWIAVNGLTTDLDVLVKTTNAEGWTNGVASIGNNTDGVGAVRVTIADLGKEWTFGYYQSSKDELTDYKNLDYGYYIDATNTLFGWSNGSLTNLGTVKKGDVISLEKTKTEIMYTKNEQVLDQKSYWPTSKFSVHFSVFSQTMLLGPVKVIKFSYWPRPIAEITHLVCGASGSINLTVNSFVPVTMYDWNGPNGFTASTQDISNLAAGLYTVQLSYINSSGYPVSIQRKYEVGYGIDWKNQLNTITSPNGGLIKAGTNNSYGESGASSTEILPYGEPGWVDFKVAPTAISPGFMQSQFYFSIGFTAEDVDVTTADIEFELRFTNNSASTSGAVLLYINDLYNGGAPSSYSVDDVFRINRAASGAITFLRNGVNMFPSLHPVPNSQARFVVDAALAINKKGIVTAYTSFGCQKAPFVYGHLKKKLNGSIYRVVNDKVYLKYREEYNATDFKFNIYNDASELIENENSIPTTTFLGYGDNRIEIPLNEGEGNISAGYYLLEVINKKNEKWYLRFKY